MTTAFDVAAAFLERAPKNSLETIKLQKLTFYAFGWYAKVTGSRLFDDRMVAMKHGPVVSELLNVHAKRLSFTLRELNAACEVSPLEDSYMEAVVDAVWSSYGSEKGWDLVEMTHLEQPWCETWREAQAQSVGSRTIPSDLVVDYFMSKTSATYGSPKLQTRNVPILTLLPDPVTLEVSGQEFEQMEAETQEVPLTAFSGLSVSFRSLLARV